MTKSIQNKQKLADNIARVQANISDACIRSNRLEEMVTLIAVSKRHPADAILEAYELGIRHFGENRLEEMETKYPQIQSQLASENALLSIHWHMIGHIQSRKAKNVPPIFDTVHSVDRVKIAQKLSESAVSLSKILKIFLEINISGEASKAGFVAYNWQNKPDIFVSLRTQLQQIIALPNLEVQGLMTMAPFLDDPEATRPYFASLATLRDELSRELSVPLPHLSMGMTNDYQVAIEEGSTMVRIGTAIFGERNS